MKRGEARFTGGCVPEAGSSGVHGCCLLCGDEYWKENCCGGEDCFCMANAEEWRDISYKNVVLFVTNFLARPYGYFWEKWFS